MIEVFKTDVESNDEAKRLISLIHAAFNTYKANFDLDDCDRILRIATENPEIEATLVISILNQNGFYAEILEDQIESAVVPFFANLF